MCLFLPKTLDSSVIFFFAGIADDPGEKKKQSLVSFLMTTNSLKLESNLDREQVDIIPHNLLDLIREQIVFIPSNANSLCRAAGYVRKKMAALYTNTVHLLEYTDSNDVTSIALEQSKHLMDNMGICKVSVIICTYI